MLINAESIVRGGETVRGASVCETKRHPAFRSYSSKSPERQRRMIFRTDSKGDIYEHNRSRLTYGSIREILKVLDEPYFLIVGATILRTDSNGVMCVYNHPRFCSSDLKVLDGTWCLIVGTTIF
uniref:Uncharacterized protein n=1 Tax=Trichuris muris TaxID=70415 RepID=A0A5S6Q1L4_TRIMR